MRSILAIALAVGCGAANPSPTTEAVPAGMLPETIGKPDRGELDLFLLGKHIGTEKFEVTQQSTGHHLKLDAMWSDRRWRMDLRVNKDWSVIEAVVEKLAETGRDTECTLRLRSTDTFMEWMVSENGEDWVQSREPKGRIYYVVVRPAVTQYALCAVATDQAVAIQNMPAFKINIAPRERMTLADGRTLDKIRVDELIDVYCDGSRLAAVHYGTHGFLAVRNEYFKFGRELAAKDPTDAPWASEFDCPKRPK